MKKNLVDARLRYLEAIGASLAMALGASGCKDPPPATSADGSTSTSTSTPKSTAPELPPDLRNMPSCPSGKFCVSEPQEISADAGGPAPNPYSKCAATADDPAAKRGGGSFRDRQVYFSADNTKAERTKTANACCYTWVIPCPGGRIFRDATGSPTVARTTTRADWTATIDALAVEDLSPEKRAELAGHWAEEAAYEHASIASFAQLTLDLLSVAAPPELLRATQHATLDEIEHARIAFALAQAYGGGVAVGPAALVASPGACRTLAAVARRTFIDACIGESIASAALAEDARQSSDPVLSELLSTVGADEERHAELAWKIVAWALRTGGAEVARTLGEAQAEIIDELVALTSDAGALAVSPQFHLRAMVLREIVLPCSVALLAGTAGDAAVDPSRRHMTS